MLDVVFPELGGSILAPVLGIPNYGWRHHISVVRPGYVEVGRECGPSRRIFSLGVKNPSVARGDDSLRSNVNVIPNKKKSALSEHGQIRRIEKALLDLIYLDSPKMDTERFGETEL